MCAFYRGTFVPEKFTHKNLTTKNQIKMKTKKLFTIIVLIVTACFRLEAATFTVTNTADSGAGSLRQAILDANALGGADIIVFDSGVFSTPQTIVVTSQLPITTDLAIIGPGANLLAIDGNNAT